MSLKKALLVFDPFRRPEQRSYVTERTEILLDVGDRAWVATTDAQAERFAEQGIVVQFDEAVDLVLLPAVNFDPLVQEAVVPLSLQRGAPTGDTAAHHLVQFIVPPSARWLDQVAVLGGEEIQAIAEAVVVFQLTSAQAAAVAALSFVRWVGLYHPAYALAFQLTGREAPFDALGLNTIAVPGSVPEVVEGQGNLEITFFDDVQPGDVRAAVEGTGATVMLETSRGFLVAASAAALSNLLMVPGLFCIEPHAASDITVDRGRAILNTPAVSRFGNIGFQVNLDGAGEIVGVIDSGLDHGNPASLGTLHPDIRGRVLRLIHLSVPNGAAPPLDPTVPDRSDHGTHVTGIIAGNGASTSGTYQGIAPAAHIVFQGPVKLPETMAPDVQQNLRMAHRQGARVHNNSYGSPPNQSPAPNNNQYLLGAAAAVDEFCLLNQESLVLFGSGNDEEDTTGRADGVLDMDRLKDQAAAKNVLAVGATEGSRTDHGEQRNYRQTFLDSTGGTLLPHRNFNTLANGKIADDPDQMALFASRGFVNRMVVGAAAPNRIKPDVVAPGTNILSLRSSLAPPPSPDPQSYPSGVNNTLYAFKSGTSMATPLVAGAAVLVRQFYRQRFGRLRELTLLEGVTRSATPPPDFVSTPSVAAHADGIMFCWVTPAAGSATKRIAVSVHARDLSRLHPDPLVLQDDTGDDPSPRVARHGDHLLLLHRHDSGEVRLSRYQKDAPPGYSLSLDTSFDTDGTLVVDAGVDASPDRAPALVVVGDDVGVLWSVGDGTALRWRRFSAVDGTTRDANPVELGDVATTSPHPFLIHNGTRYAAAWAHRVGDTRSVRFAIADAEGNLTADPPQDVVAGEFDIYDPHVAWNERAGLFAVVWCERHETGNQIALRFMNPDSTQAPTTTVPVRVPSDFEVRRPYVGTHATQGFILVWEDNRQAGQFALNLALLGENGRVDNRIEPNPLDPDNRRLLRISDTVQDTQGHAVFADGAGIVTVWQSLEEAHRDRLDVSATPITLEGSFSGTADPRQPMIVRGKYRPDRMRQMRNLATDGVSMAWVGGDYYYLRWEADEEPLAFPRIVLVRTDAAGRVDATYGANGARVLSADLFDRRMEMHWTGRYLACITSGLGFTSLMTVTVFDEHGELEAPFGTNGTFSFDELAHGDVSPQLADIDLGPLDFGLIVAYGTGLPTATRLHYVVLNSSGDFVDGDGNAIPPGDPVAQDLFVHPEAFGAIGTARHGWFHFVAADGGSSAAAWHQRPNLAANARFDVFIRRFDHLGAPLGAPVPLLGPRAPGDDFDAMNAVLAPRPVGLRTAADSRRREFGVAWQHRDAPADPWQIRFSQLDRFGAVRANPAMPTPANPNVSNVQVVFPGMTDAGGTPVWPPDPAIPMHAMEPQLTSTYTDAPWRPLPGAAAALPITRDEWAPSYGLAWIGQPVAGATRRRVLYFMVIDENGSPIQLDPRPVPAVPPSFTPMATNDVSVPTALSDAGANVMDFKLIWNGRVFHLTWTENDGSHLRHMRVAITRNGHLDAYAQPSSALLRATLIGGATNINHTSLPNIPPTAAAAITPANINFGYGWGRVNLRQSLVPSGPVTFYAFDDGAVGPGRSAHYHFAVPAGTVLLRATLVWTDPPGARRVHNLDLRIRGAGREYHGNTWQTVANHLHESLAAAATFDTDNTIEQIVIPNPPAGEYEVEVEGQTVMTRQIAPFPAQPFALVVVGSGPEVRYQRDAECVLPFH